MVNPEQTELSNPPGPAGTESLPIQFGSRYFLLKELGKGGMGQVFMGVTGDQDFQRVCALKIIQHLDNAQQPSGGSDELRKRFDDEARVVTKLSQENLVYVFDFGIVGEPPDEQGYLAMEYLRGKTLTEVWNRCALKQVGFPLGISLFAVSEVAAGLASAHSLSNFNLVHRDISPSNVMVTYTGGVKLIDFGLAKWNRKSAQTMTGVNWGKISYMSPEQYTGRKIDHRSDIFSLGVILWELLTGRQLYIPQEGRRPTGPIVPPSSLNQSLAPELDQVVLKALATNPDDRFQIASELGQALLHFMPKDAGKLDMAGFMQRMFEPDIKKEELEEEHLLAKVSQMRRSPPKPPGGANDKAPPIAPEQPIKKIPVATSANDADPLIGTVLADRYYVKRKIGEGAMGQVYEGHHTGIGKRVAIKIPRHTERRKAKLLQRFRMEATAASQIGHINIADVTDCGTTPAGDFFFVMEYLDGVDLGRVIRKEGVMALERALLFSIQICRALEAAHKAGIIHRDLKPSNVMLVRDREDNELVKVLDFGVAKFLRKAENNMELTVADAAIGTPRYMAPEQIEAGRTIDFRIDIYAVGGLLYAMLSGGRAPFEADDVQDVWKLKTTSDPTPLSRWRSDLPEDLIGVVMGCLMRDPNLRPKSMEHLKRELLRILEEVRQTGSSVMALRLASSTVAIAEGDSTAADLPRRRWLVPAVATAGVGLLIAMGLWLRAREPAPVITGSTITTTPASNAKPQAGGAPRPSQQDPARVSLPPQAANVAPPMVPPPQNDGVTTALDTQGGNNVKPAKAGQRPTTAPDNAALLAEAEQAFRRGQLMQAAVLGEKIVSRKPSVDGYLLLGKTYLFMDEATKAVRAYQKALKLAPNNAAARRGLEKAQEKAGP